ncbi:MAG: hypothetical protein EZS28_030319 [Streblomastix strix]|uniref:Uncharacterized protein n=1 Tax=Streblomastix strix TaxID=222440 RepID=A0A5J4UV29_9EUKA|nr:MAG: hypothetical protein EZS28_030319 [Streblomastix strix]
METAKLNVTKIKVEIGKMNDLETEIIIQMKEIVEKIEIFEMFEGKGVITIIEMVMVIVISQILMYLLNQRVNYL